MTSQALFYEIGAVGDDLVEEASYDLPKRRRWVLPAACAACAAVIVAGVWLGSGIDANDGTVLDEPGPSGGEINVCPPVGLPMLTLGEEMWDGMGFEGISAYDISEYRSGGPELPEELPETLPVYANHVTRDDQVTQAEKETELTRVQEYFESEIASGGVSVKFWTQPRIEFEPALTLPEEYRGAEQSAEVMQALGEYLLETYPAWFSWMENPTVRIQGGDYNIHGKQRYELHISDAGQSYTDDLLGAAYRDMWLCLDEEDGLWIIWIYWPDLSDVIGEYPIISADEAQELLLNGNYASSVPYEISGADSIQKVELCYRNDRTATWVPYYRFWVEIPAYENQEKLGLSQFGAYYVPAVESRYIANKPTYDGSFN